MADGQALFPSGEPDALREILNTGMSSAAAAASALPDEAVDDSFRVRVTEIVGKGGMIPK